MLHGWNGLEKKCSLFGQIQDGSARVVFTNFLLSDGLHKRSYTIV